MTPDILTKKMCSHIVNRICAFKNLLLMVSNTSFQTVPVTQRCLGHFIGCILYRLESAINRYIF